MSKGGPWQASLERRTFQWLHALRGSFFLLVVLLPPLFFGGTVRSSGFLIQTFILAGAALYVVQLVLFETDTAHLDRIRKPLIFFCLFIGYIALQWLGKDLVFSKGFPGSIAVFKTRDYLIQLLCYTLFFVSSLDLIASRKKIGLLTLLIGLQTVFLMALGYYQQNSHPEKLSKLYGVFDLSQYGTFFSSFTNPNHYGGYLMLATILFLAWIAYYLATVDFFKIDGDFSKALFFGLLCVLTSFSILHASARAALLVQIWSAFIFGIMTLNTKIKRGVSWGLVLAIGAALAGSIFFLIFTKIDLSHLSPAILWRDFGERTGIYADAVKIVWDFPVFGTGLGTVMYAISAYQTMEVEQYSWIHLCNHQLELITNTGLVGYFLFMVPLVWLALSSFRACLNHPSRWRRIYGIGSLTALGAVVIFSVVDDYLITPALAILFLVHLMILTLCGNKNALSLDERADAPVSQRDPAQRVALDPRHLRNGGIALVGLFLIFLTAWKDFTAINIVSKSDGDIRQLNKASSLRPDDPKVWIKIGDHYFEKAGKLRGSESVITAKRSVEAYDKAVSLTPMYGYYWMLAGRARVLARDRVEGLRHIARSADLVPHNRDYYLYLIVTSLYTAQLTPWADEREVLREYAYEWVKKTSRLKNPLTETDYGYIRNYGEDCYGVIPQDIKDELLALIKRAKSEAAVALIVSA